MDMDSSSTTSPDSSDVPNDNESTVKKDEDAGYDPIVMKKFRSEVGSLLIRYNEVTLPGKTTMQLLYYLQYTLNDQRLGELDDMFIQELGRYNKAVVMSIYNRRDTLDKTDKEAFEKLLCL